MKRAAALVLLLIAVACDRRRPAGSGPYADRVDDAIPKIEKATGLRYKTRPKVEIRSRDQVRQFLLRKFQESTPARELRGEEQAYKLFGLIPDSLDLERFLVSLLTEQIVGYYDPEAKTLYVVQDAPDDLAGITVTHELVHALQDQYVNLDSIQREQGNSDRQAAAQAVLEGQATYEQMSIMVGGDVAASIPGGWERIRETIRENQGAMPIFAAAPMAIQETLLFPYLSGAEFVRRFKSRRLGYSVLDTLPISTEQILNDGAYFGSPRDVPSEVVLPSTADTAAYEETMGEFGTRLFLYQHLQNNTDAVSAAQGWDGDRFRVVHLRTGLALAWASVWDSPVEAAQFVDEVGQAIGKRYRTSAPVVSSAGVRTYQGSGRTVVVTPFEAGGRAAVLYVDVPAGASPTIMPVGRIVVRPH